MLQGTPTLINNITLKRTGVLPPSERYCRPSAGAKGAQRSRPPARRTTNMWVCVPKSDSGISVVKSAEDRSGDYGTEAPSITRWAGVSFFKERSVRHSL